MTLDLLLRGRQYARTQSEKEKLLLPELIALTRHHANRCPAYAKIVRLTAPDFENAQTPAQLPYLPAGLFKSHKLQSVPDENVRTMLVSSGTEGQVSRIALDDLTAKNQARALTAVMREAFGDKRMPLLLIESEETIKTGSLLNARGAGVLGFMAFGRQPVFALNAKMRLCKDTVADFLMRHGNAPFLIFGFTFMIWKYFHQATVEEGFDCRNGILIHGGGWKKTEDEAIGNSAFRAALGKNLGIAKIFNFYGMAEQTGTALLEGEDGCLYPPAFGDVIIRDPHGWRALPPGEPGIVQVLSLIPRSYPGHSILTEDRGFIAHIDAGNGGRMGKAVRILGRAPKAELRGCGDVHAYGVAA